jgi:hypothetical protein
MLVVDFILVCMSVIAFRLLKMADKGQVRRFFSKLDQLDRLWEEIAILSKPSKRAWVFHVNLN